MFNDCRTLWCIMNALTGLIMCDAFIFGAEDLRWAMNKFLCRMNSSKLSFSCVVSDIWTSSCSACTRIVYVYM